MLAELTSAQIKELTGNTGYLSAHMTLGQDSAGGPDIFHLATGLSVLSTALSGHNPVYSKFLDPLQSLYCHTYRLTLGPTGSGKTRAERVGQSVLAKADSDLFLPGDFSREALYDTLSERPYGYLGVDEFKGLQNRLNRDYNAGAREFLTEAYDSPPLIKRKTKADGDVEIRSPRITLTAGSTPEWFESAIRDGDFEGGWLSRFLFFHSDIIVPLARSRSQRIQAVFDSLVEHIEKVGNLSGPANFDAVDEQAWSYMERTHLNIANAEPALRGFWARINVHTVKLAIMFHVSDYPDDLDIQIGDWTRAVLLMDKMAETVKTLVNSVAFSRSGKDLERLRKITSNPDGTDRRTALQRSHMKASEFETYLGTLIQTGERHIYASKNEHGPSTKFIHIGETCPKCSQNGVAD